MWANKCPTAKAAKTNGKTKCNEKNLFNVAFDTENPPQINSTKSLPNTGIALSKLVILFIISKFKF